jgi:hypothetical protein
MHTIITLGQRVLHTVIAILLLVIVSISETQAAETNDVALSMVNKLALGKDLPLISFQAAITNVTYRMMDQKVGEAKARSLIQEEIIRLLPKYQEQWDKSLAVAYAKLFSPEELQSLAEKKEASEYFRKLSEKRLAVRQSIQSTLKTLLSGFVTEATSGAFTHAISGS